MQLCPPSLTAIGTVQALESGNFLFSSKEVMAGAYI